jgi:hypothetical protein
LKTDAEKLYKKLTNLKRKKDAPKRQTREGCMGLCGPKVDILDHYERRLGIIEDNVRTEQSSLASKVHIIILQYSKYVAGVIRIDFV